MSIDRNVIMRSMEMYISVTRSHMSVTPQRIELASMCMNEIRVIHETLMLFDNQFDTDTLAYLNAID